ncbi:zinc finger protein 58-like isoform X1 [Cloeon dipterum]|uniref:zinc finger protein 58-like isoform X1 n=1 Tax=Cloeon dipterum TaxID=197152 RepID=UPI003220834B
MESHSRSLRSKEGKTPIQKPLCRLCECPTSDGHVLASQVDRFKLRKWAMEVMNLTEEDENLPDVVEEDALICYFCIWQAEFGDESGDEAVAWWPKNLELEENAKVLRENYSVGEVEQCWVQLEEVDLAEYTKKIPETRKFFSGECIYCGNRFNKLMDHVRLMHKDAIKCGIRGCMTYFHTEEEKEQHMQQNLHAKRNKPRESSIVVCEFCQNVKFCSSLDAWRHHMKRVHPDFPVRCPQLRCIEYFKTKSEMIVHVNSWHKRGINQEIFECKHCEYYSRVESHLRQHEQRRHMPKIFKCDICDAKFGSKRLLKTHYSLSHTFDKCKSCGLDVSLESKSRHRKPLVCPKCNLSLECSGLYQLHRKSCRETVSRCEECGKTFNTSRQLNHHSRKVHTKTAIVFCEHCNHSTYIKRRMRLHMERKHLPKTIKCEDCNKLYGSEYFLKDHKSKVHSFLRCAECAREIGRHKMYKHQTVKTCHRCKCKFKCLGLLENHRRSCWKINFQCDKCPNIYITKKGLFNHIVRTHNDAS